MLKSALVLSALLLGSSLAVAAEPQMSEKPFHEFELGNPKAKVTVIEYASLTCPHCAHFQAETYPQLKKAYIDTGKIRFLYRDFPLDGIAMAGAVVARCVDPKKGHKLVEILFEKQRDWVSHPPLDGLHTYGKEAGLADGEVDKCLENKELLKTLREEQERSEQKYNIQATPSLYINDEELAGDVPFDELAPVIEKHLKLAEAGAKAAPKKK